MGWCCFISPSIMLDTATYFHQSCKGCQIVKHKSPFLACSHAVSRVCGPSVYLTYSSNLQVRLLSYAISYKTGHNSFVSRSVLERNPLSTSSVYGWGGFYASNQRSPRMARSQIYASLDVATAVDVINDLGLDTLTLLMVTVFVVPAFKTIKASPILGFFFAGIVLNQFGLIRNLTDVKVLSEWGILFLVILSTLAFTAFELPPNGAIGTRILEFLFHSRSDLVNIRSIDEAIVIGAALSLSSSAFVLQLLAEKGELPTRFGSATLGILLLQDIAVVPLLVILPVLENQNLGEESIWPMLAQESLKALGGLGLLSLGGKFLLRRVLSLVHFGWSNISGNKFRTQIEADIRPFRGLLLGLFFVTTGTSIDMQLLFREWPNVLSLLAGLIVIKTLIITAIGPRVGLTLQESVRIGLLLSQGGEFGFVVFSLANSLGVLPLELNKLLIIVVVLSMSSDIKSYNLDHLNYQTKISQKADEMVNFEVNERLLSLDLGKWVLANFLSTPLASGVDGDAVGRPFVAFDLDPSVVKGSRKLGFPVLYGDGSRPAVLQSAGISSPKAVMIMYTEKKRTIEAVERLRLAFPGIPIYVRAQDLTHLLDLKKAGATDAILEDAETSLQLGSKLLKGLGVMSDDVNFLSQLVRDSMELQAQEALTKSDDQDIDIMKPLQVRVADFIGPEEPISSTSQAKTSSDANQTDSTHVMSSSVVDQAKQLHELQQSENSEYDGVLYCELDKGNGPSTKSKDAEVEKIMLDSSIPCAKLTNNE
ncbi:hypothetical protein FNV43_RR22943 [Rhamnella rubrinervis]|uniref:RCK N-terminal domain-containing protein n=1 Tax=Rhamnella rubrinervis TaxID=2594499 RepID=A0A8K0GSI0_9ROSA|nr:hypothetical protein FNV43_RR22943 [Rhamnella rubrinervis]